MKNGIHFRSLVLGAMLGAAIVLSVAAAADPAARNQWEYKTIEGRVFGNEPTRLDEAINTHVADGWELVSAHPLADHFGFVVLRREGSQ